MVDADCPLKSKHSQREHERYWKREKNRESVGKKQKCRGEERGKCWRERDKQEKVTIAEKYWRNRGREIERKRERDGEIKELNEVEIKRK